MKTLFGLAVFGASAIAADYTSNMDNHGLNGSDVLDLRARASSIDSPSVDGRECDGAVQAAKSS